MPASLSIKQKLGFVTLLTATVGLLIAGSMFAAHDYLTARDALTVRVQSHARMTAAAVAGAVEAGDRSEVATVLRMLASDHAVVAAQISTPAVSGFAEFDANLLPATELANTIEAVADITRSGRALGRISVRADRAELRQCLLYDIRMAALTVIIALCGALPLASWLLRNIYQPIQNLSETARRVQESRNYALRARVFDNDEIGRLSADFNGMLTEIERGDRELESEVAQRTEELQRRNLELSNQIAERTQTENRLLQSEQRFKSAFESAAIGMILINENRSLFHVNQAFADMLGYQLESLAGTTIRELTHPDDREAGLYQYHELIGGQIDRYQIEKRYQHKDGHSIWVLCHVSAVRDTEQRYQYAIGQIQDITEAHELSKELSYQATHDSLTGLVNRREFEARIEYALEGTWRNGKEHAICYLDLDQFKVINDTCGHVAGDELLRQIANVLKAKVRVSDTIARLGGDEFGLLMENCPLAQSQRLACRR